MAIRLINKIIKFTKSRKFEVFALLFILVGAFVVRLWKIDNPVADWHSWRQADTASVTKVFVEEGVDLLHPKYHDLSKIQTGYENPEGYRFVEFPLFNLVHAIFYNLAPSFGINIWGRLISIFFAVNSTYFLYGIGKRVFDKWVGLASAFFYAFVPFNIYFTRVILPDPMSISLGVGSVYFFVIYTGDRRVGWLLTSAFMMSVAILVKPHAIFFGVPILYLVLTHWRLKDIIKNKWFFVAMDIVLVPFLLWRVWMYREELIRGIAHWKWAFNGNGIRFKPSFWFWIFGERVAKLILGYWGVFVFMVGAMFAKKVNIVHAFLAGAFLYVSVFASANVMHDYYQAFVVPALALALGVGVFTIWNSEVYNKILARGGLILVLGLMFALGFYNVRGNWRVNDTGAVLAGEEADKLLPKDALVIAPYNGDTTFLYQTGRKGWPVVTASIERMIEMGADYYVSVNLSEPDTINFSNRFEEVVRTEKYVILDLHKVRGEANEAKSS